MNKTILFIVRSKKKYSNGPKKKYISRRLETI